MRQASFHASKGQITAAIKRAARELELDIEKNTANEIVLFHGGGLLSFGNKITVRVEQGGDNRLRVVISSKSAALLQLIDWGMNESLESDLMNELKNIIGR